MLERLVGLPEVTVGGVFANDERVELPIEPISERPRGVVCGVAVLTKGWREVVFVGSKFKLQSGLPNP
jgi:hypothetical protein